jgi:hypothetical protein
MFQYASALGIASHHNVPLYLDLSWFKISKGLANTTPRKFSLNVFDFNYEENNTLFSNDSLSIIGRCRRKIVKISPKIFKEKKIYNESSYSFDPNVFNLSSPFLLNGYWQSAKYFSEVSEKVSEIFGTPNNLSSQSNLMIDQIASTDSICIHIRRGDYVTNPIALKTHGLCSIDYYKEGIQSIAKDLSQPHCYVFSDDIEWSKSNLLTSVPMTFVDFNGPAEAHQDLWLMAACKHFVIANSSLSWWGAYLGKHPGKKVVSPKNWFNDKALNTNDLYLDSWVRL